MHIGYSVDIKGLLYCCSIAVVKSVDPTWLIPIPRCSVGDVTVFIMEQLAGLDVLTYLANKREYSEQHVVTITMQVRTDWLTLVTDPGHHGYVSGILICLLLYPYLYDECYMYDEC